MTLKMWDFTNLIKNIHFYEHKKYPSSLITANNDEKKKFRRAYSFAIIKTRWECYLNRTVCRVFFEWHLRDDILKINGAMSLKEKINQKFEQQFGHPGTMYSSAGRINLIGEHTDYNGGLVFPEILKRGGNCGIMDQFASVMGKVTASFKEICSFGSAPFNGVNGVSDDRIERNPLWFDINGRRVSGPSSPGLYVNNGRKIIVNYENY